MRTTRLAAATLLVLGTVTACVDKEKCDEALRVTRDALAKEQPDLARQWRDRAFKVCEDPAVSGPLDKEILDKEAELKKRVEDAARQVAAAAQKRMNTAQQVWLAYDALEQKARNAERLAAHEEKARRMSDGLPAEYAKQVDAYNQREHEKRRAALPPEPRR